MEIYKLIIKSEVLPGNLYATISSIKTEYNITEEYFKFEYKANERKEEIINSMKTLLGFVPRLYLDVVRLNVNDAT